MAVAGLLQLASTVFSLVMELSSPQTESLPQLILQAVQEALDNQNIKELVQRVEGFSTLSAKIVLELQQQQQKSSYEGFDSSRFDPFHVLLGELRSNIVKRVNNDDEAKRYLSCINAYVHLATQYQVILSWHLSLSQLHGSHTSTSIKLSLGHVTKEARHLLGFLSDKLFLGPAGIVDDNKLLKMKAYRSAVVGIFPTIRKFLIMLDLEPESDPPVYSIEDAEDAHSTMSKRWPIKWEEETCKMEGVVKGYDRFVLFNHTSLPIRIFSGMTGMCKNLSFIVRQYIVNQARAIYTHRCGKRPYLWRNCSVGGLFCVGAQASDYKDPKDVTDGALIEFAVSRGFGLHPSLSVPVPEFSQALRVHTYSAFNFFKGRIMHRKSSRKRRI